MFAAVSILDEVTAARVRQLWQDLEEKCGLTGIRFFPFPHFTYQVAEHYEMPQMHEAMNELSNKLGPLKVRTTGLGLFTGLSPVIYIPVVKSPALIAFHQQVWDCIFPFAAGNSPFYSPETWVPHISVALQDVNLTNLACAVNLLAFQPLEMEITINNLSVVSQEGSEVGQLRSNFQLKG